MCVLTLQCALALQIECKDWSVDAALEAFRVSRPPGIYREAFLRALYERYDADGLGGMRVPLPPVWDETAVFWMGVSSFVYVLVCLTLTLPLVATAVHSSR